MLQRLGRGEHPASQQQLKRERPGEKARQSQHAAGVRDDAQSRLGQAELGVLGRDDKVGGEYQLEAAARRDAVDRGDHRFRPPVQLRQPGETARPVIGVDRFACRRGLEVPARAEEPVARSGHDPGAQAGVGLEHGERLVQRVAGGYIDGVRAGPVQRDREHAVGRLRPDRPPAWLAGSRHVRRPARAAWPAR